MDYTRDIPRQTTLHVADDDGQKQYPTFENEPLHEKTNKRTNGPVNAHLRSAAYTNKYV